MPSKCSSSFKSVNQSSQGQKLKVAVGKVINKKIGDGEFNNYNYKIQKQQQQPNLKKKIRTNNSKCTTAASNSTMTSTSTYTNVSLSGSSSEEKHCELDLEIKRKYKILSRLGKGAYGIVWECVDLDSGNRVALKKIYDAFRNDTDAQRTYREIMFLRQFGTHANIISLRNVHKAANNMDIYLVFPLMDVDLHKLIKYSPERLLATPNVIKSITYQMLKAIKFIHSAHVIHRDLKPANILLDKDLNVKLADFGLSRSLVVKKEDFAFERNPLLTDYVATRWYRPPEILLSCKNYTKGIDIWSFGCIVAEMLLRNPLFPAKTTIAQLETIMKVIEQPTPHEIEEFGSSAPQMSMIESFAAYRDNSLKNIFKGFEFETLNFLEKILIFSPAKRMNVEECLRHPFMKGFHCPSKEMSSDPVSPPLNDNIQLSVFEYRSAIYKTFEREKLAKNDSYNKINSGETPVISKSQSSYFQNENNNNNLSKKYNQYSIHTLKSLNKNFQPEFERSKFEIGNDITLKTKSSLNQNKNSARINCPGGGGGDRVNSLKTNNNNDNGFEKSVKIEKDLKKRAKTANFGEGAGGDCIIEIIKPKKLQNNAGKIIPSQQPNATSSIYGNNNNNKIRNKSGDLIYNKRNLSQQQQRRISSVAFPSIKAKDANNTKEDYMDFQNCKKALFDLSKDMKSLKQKSLQTRFPEIKPKNNSNSSSAAGDAGNSNQSQPNSVGFSIVDQIKAFRARAMENINNVPSVRKVASLQQTTGEQKQKRKPQHQFQILYNNNNNRQNLGGNKGTTAVSKSSNNIFNWNSASTEFSNEQKRHSTYFPDPVILFTNPKSRKDIFNFNSYANKRSHSPPPPPKTALIEGNFANSYSKTHGLIDSAASLTVNASSLYKSK